MSTTTEQTATTPKQTEQAELTQLHYIGVVLAAITGVIHLGLGVGTLSSDPTNPLGIAFVGAAAGFAGGIIGVLRGDKTLRTWVILLGIPFTAGQIVLYVVFNWPDIISIGGVVDKVVQLALIAVLFVLYRRES
ncbi:hypothetical protein E6P09_05095 [Haloferax mediterranei ATCC 33500]|uniref:Integral membrane protein n=1 Tax=Haloferax mediterranei (strain ATCC 33500 / DSM 1411 / JCM 8866 / NBRC 14739 / NCIMB 2177 / R-4) TaxID=523841 RepID=I3R1N1_HALMT|nr:hypothetical protein [Haloferax mediterranei]AFK18141.1 hypothetical protein HFX_0405 [Haloferax mediterranei ATCC 33500]AHZ22453.1 hypothetical protein BM92_07245 [Haloferax mediterranei ATCC 33500]EMA02586.1 hypothetical protein C439_08385 [Haloferax mediterranei ATCC 33500]MDX5988231.1 hypothetical protein [Haloferax mediterranei ATCC 33500]QCQ74673.1 hypothetical protein E6P09_05095 [Haloferax mediterranei ATCC 33500]